MKTTFQTFHQGSRIEKGHKSCPKPVNISTWFTGKSISCKDTHILFSNSLWKVSWMKLRELRIQHFKSIEDAIIEKIGDIDVFSGRNNSGKTAIFEILTNLRHCQVYPNISYSGFEPKFFTGQNLKKIMKITLIFELNNDERSEGIMQYYHGENPKRHDVLMKSKFLEKIEYTFQSAKVSNNIGLHQIRVTGTNGKFCVIAQKGKKGLDTTDIHSLLLQGRHLTSQVLENTEIIEGLSDLSKRRQLRFPFLLFRELINRVYVFSPFRRSTRRLPAQENRNLSPDGQNLVQRLFTIKSNEDENWKSLGQFVKIALPDLGSLQARQIGKETETHFRDKKWKIEIDIHDMGSGIEQLLMIATFLISESQDSLILIETPEHHLHPGAQRTLLQFIRENLKDNQVLITTHSPVFLSQRDISLHVVTKTNEGTKVNKVEELEDLSLALNELGSKNSDVLLADFVLFVEGPTDEKIFKAWAKTLGIDFDSKNIFCITIGGSRNFDYYANSDVLQRISLKSPVPHLFIIDRDEKSEDTIQKIQSSVKELHVLERREIENYLLFPKLILKAMKNKTQGNPDTLQKLQNVQPKDIEQVLLFNIDELKHHVIVKRIKEEIGGGTFLPDRELNYLIKSTKNIDTRALTDKITKVIQVVLDEQCGEERIKQTVNEQFLSVNKIWTEGNEEEKKKVVPGEEVLTEVFKEFGFNYDKMKDGERIAQQMKKEDIPSEIKTIINKILV